AHSSPPTGPPGTRAPLDSPRGGAAPASEADESTAGGSPCPRGNHRLPLRSPLRRPFVQGVQDSRCDGRRPPGKSVEKRRRGHPPKGTLSPKWSDWGRLAQFALEVPMTCTDVYSNVRLIYRLVLAVDVEKYSARDARQQLRAQTDLRNILSDAAEKVGLD